MQNMDYKYIEQLLERYWNCQTSLEEEAILKAFFCQDKVPAGLEKYKSLFAYAATEQKADKLGDDFDERMMELIDEPAVVNAKIVPFRQRLAPLFKAAAVVAIILTLGNASQIAFNDKAETNPDATALAPKVQNGPNVAMGGDSVKVDTLKKAVSTISGVIK